MTPDLSSGPHLPTPFRQKPRALRTTAKNVFTILLVIVIIIILPQLVHYPWEDSGMFLYIGKGILEGDMPYLDRWDHKPPMIFWINALGIYLGSGSLWALWLIEMAFICGSSIIGYAALSVCFGAVPALFGSVLWVISLYAPLGGGNYTEEYALLFQFTSIFLFVHAESRNRHTWQPFAIGACSAAAFLLKQPLVGIWIAMGLLFLFRGVKGISIIARMAAGAATLLAAVMAYFAANGALAAFWDAAFTANMAYSNIASMEDRYRTMVFGLRLLPSSILVLAAVGFALLCLLSGRIKEQPRRAVVILAVMDLPLELILASMSGFQFGHYFISLMPATAMLGAYFAHSIGGNDEITCLDVAEHRADNCMSLSPASQWLLSICLGALAINAYPVVKAAAFAAGQNVRQDRASTYGKVADFISKTTQPDDCILVWGMGGTIYFLADRRSPTRFFAPFQMLTKGYATAELIEGFVNDVRADMPEVIVDMFGMNLPPLVVKAGETREIESSRFVMPDHLLDPFFRLIETHYRLEREIGGWAVYRLNNGSSSSHSTLNYTNERTH